MPGKPPPDDRDGLTRLKRVVHDLRSPGGCPWDREQTHESLLTNLLEEAYECVEAIQSGDTAHMCEELGDLLLQVVLHAEIASETGAFDLDAIAHGIAEKLIRRHPHVYGESGAGTTGEVLAQWEAIKAAERGGAEGSRFQGISRGMPGLIRALKIQKRAAKAGFDWPDAGGVLDKLREELAEAEEALEAGSPERIAAEAGDILFTAVNLIRKLNCDPEVLLAATSDRFVRRFERMEESLAASGVAAEKASLEQMESHWQQAKVND